MRAQTWIPLGKAQFDVEEYPFCREKEPRKLRAPATERDPAAAHTLARDGGGLTAAFDGVRSLSGADWLESGKTTRNEMDNNIW